MKASVEEEYVDATSRDTIPKETREDAMALLRVLCLSLFVFSSGNLVFSLLRCQKIL